MRVVSLAWVLMVGLGVTSLAVLPAHSVQASYTMGSVHVLNAKKSIVLIVEHEAIIRMNIVQVVEGGGHEILQAASAV
jgi:hypothetical protein